MVKETLIDSEGRFCVLTHGILEDANGYYSWKGQVHWCDETFGEDFARWQCQRFNPLTQIFRFTNESDRMLFILRWS